MARWNITNVPEEIDQLVREIGKKRRETVGQAVLRMVCDRVLEGGDAGITSRPTWRVENMSKPTLNVEIASRPTQGLIPAIELTPEEIEARRVAELEEIERVRRELVERGEV